MVIIDKKNTYVKFLKIGIFTLFYVLILVFKNYAADVKGQEHRNEVMYTLGIIDNLDNMDRGIKRSEFAKMVIKSSVKKDYVNDINLQGICNDVSNDDIYASYIKSAIENKYMFVYLGGYFKPDEYVTYSDLSRACLALLSYTDEDFTGNKVIARNMKFKELELDENVTKNEKQIMTKTDIINGLYNTLKKDFSIFDKLYKDEDGELIASGTINTKLMGPYIAKKGNDPIDIDIPFDYENNDIYINGVRYSSKELKDDLDNYGYILYYYDKQNMVTYAYTERTDISATMAVKRGYVDEVNYSLDSMITPISVDIDRTRYIIDGEAAKVAFSYAGDIKKDDHIIFIYGKTADRLEDDAEDISIKVKGYIIYALKYDVKY